MRASTRIADHSRRAEQDACDWFEKGWINVCDTERFGKGIFATRNMQFDSRLEIAYQKNKCSINFPIIGSIDSASIMSPQYAENLDVKNTRYLITVDESRAFDLSTHWSGSINHAPPSKANICLDGVTIRQIREIKTGDQLLYEYGLGYWIYQVSHRDVNEFTKDQRRVWKRIYLVTEDYTELLNKRLYDWSHPMDVIEELTEHLSK